MGGPLFFSECRFVQEVRISRSLFREGTTMDRGALEGPLSIQESTFPKGLTFEGVKLRAGAGIVETKAGELAFKDMSLNQVKVSGSTDHPTRINSVQGCDLSTASFENVELSQCTFLRATHLDSLRLSGEVGFNADESALDFSGAAALRLRLSGLLRRRKRDTLQDEVTWRRSNSFIQRLFLTMGPDGYRQDQRREARYISGLYRQLRRIREQARNEPGAADFYYGEMEMRRMGDQWSSRMIVAPATGITPSLYTRHLRAERAARLLETTSLTVDQITAAVGYRNPTSLRHLFAQHHGINPTTYRQTRQRTNR